MWQVLLYTLGISVALSLAAFCGERLSSMLGRSKRFIWAAAMLLSILWPLGMTLSARPLPAPVLVAAQGGVPAQAVTLDVPAARMATPVPLAMEPDAAAGMPARTQKKWRELLPPDRVLLQAWALVSGALLLCLSGTDLFLHYRSARWRRMRVLDQQVLVSEATGPALLGAWRPKIVVPRWFLDERAATQLLILEHERQHIAARDPVLLRLALLFVAAVPWNLPLWWQLRRLRQAIELDCDARVLRGGAEADSYGGVLLAVAQRAGNVPAGAIAMGEPVSALEKRIQHLTRSKERLSAPRALAAMIFCAAGFGVALALDAPALPQSQAKVMVRHTTPVARAQSAPESRVSSRSEAPMVASEVPAPVGILAAAQTPWAARESAAQPRARVEGAPALPRLLPPTPFSGPPLDPEDPRSDKSTQAAVLAARPNLESEYTGNKLLTVFMTEDGKIDRSYVINDVREILGGDFVFPAALTPDAPTGIIPELLSKRWEPLGLGPEQLGHMGLTIFDNKNNPGVDSIYVLYAWPRRPAEPIGGFSSYDAVGWPYRSSFTYADAVAVVEHYLPGALGNKGATPDGTPWLLLSTQGEVVSSGYQPGPSKWARIVMDEANPGKNIGLVLTMTNKVIIGWLEPAQSGNE